MIEVCEIRWKEWVNLSCLTGEKRRSQRDNNEEGRADVHSSDQSELLKVTTESSGERRERIPHDDPCDSKLFENFDSRLQQRCKVVRERGREFEEGCISDDVSEVGERKGRGFAKDEKRLRRKRCRQRTGKEYIKTGRG